MLFKLSLTKVMIVVALSVLLFGVPLMAFLVTIKEKYRKRRQQGEHASWPS